MKAIKIIFICVAIIVFLAAATIGFLGATGKIQFSTNASVIALCSSCLGMVATVLNAKHLFEDSEAEKKLKTEHLDAVLRLKEEQADAIRRIQMEHDEYRANTKETIRKLQAQIPKAGGCS